MGYGVFILSNQCYLDNFMKLLQLILNQGLLIQIYGFITIHATGNNMLESFLDLSWCISFLNFEYFKEIGVIMNRYQRVKMQDTAKDFPVMWFNIQQNDLEKRPTPRQVFFWIHLKNKSFWCIIFINLILHFFSKTLQFLT